ncbi:MAG: hypothetical protein QM602_05000, partial [Microbacterium sp.]
MSRRILSALALGLAAVVLAACAGMPTAGSVQQGMSAADATDSTEIVFRPASPQQGATPAQIVEGFVAAGTSPSGGWAIAREYLAESIRQEWKPTAAVTVDSLADRVLAEIDEDSFAYTVSPVAEVDETGAYAETDAGSSTLPFELAKQADGEWRITELEDGIVLDRSLFPAVFRAYSLMYFDPSWQSLVPDVRWFAIRDNTVSRIVKELLDGAPSPWLTGAVVSAFPDDISAPTTVPVTSERVAHVEVPSSALALPPAQQARMQVQLEASLASANVADVVMTVGTIDLDVSPASVRSTRVDARPAVLTEDGFGFLASDELQPIAGLTEGLSDSPALADATAIELSPDQDFAAVQLPSGDVVRLRDDQSFDTVDARTGLIAPSVDGFGYVWSVPGAHPTA